MILKSVQHMNAEFLRNKMKENQKVMATGIWRHLGKTEESAPFEYKMYSPLVVLITIDIIFLYGSNGMVSTSLINWLLPRMFIVILSVILDWNVKFMTSMHSWNASSSGLVLDASLSYDKPRAFQDKHPSPYGKGIWFCAVRDLQDSAEGRLVFW